MLTKMLRSCGVPGTGTPAPSDRSQRPPLGFVLLCLASLFLLSCGGPIRRVDSKNPDERSSQDQVGDVPDVLVVNLSLMLGTTELARCHRSIREAGAGVKYVIFRMNEAGAFGESRGDLESLFDRLQSTDVSTVAVLGGRVTFGAAELALMCDKVYCLRGAQWGQIDKPEAELEGYLQGDPDEYQAKRWDTAREMLKSRLDRRTTPLRPDAVRLALAMADPRMQLFSATVREDGLERQRILDAAEMTELSSSGAAIIGENRLPRPLMVTAEEAETYGLSAGTLQGFDQLADLLAYDRDRMGELTVNWAEKMVEWLELLSPFLLVAGFLLLLVELKTPGTGLPGLLGCVFLGLSLFHSYLVGLAEVTEILVFFLGIAAIAVEIFLLPGTVVFGLVGFLCLILSLVLSRQSFVLPSNAVEEQILVTNLGNLVLLFVVVAVLGFLMWRLLPHVPVFNRLMLPPPGSGREPASNSEPSQLAPAYDKLVALVGRVGRAATVLRPTGTMEIDRDRIDVVTEGDFVDQGAAVKVLYVQGNRVVVGLQEGPADAAGSTAGRDGGETGSVGLVVMLCVVGLVLIVAEVFFVTFGVIGFLAAGSLLGALFVAFQESVPFGIVMSLVEAFAAPTVFFLAFKALPHTPFGRQLILSGPATEGSAAAGDAGLASLLDKRGVTQSPLRPTGFARIEGQKVDVVTRGEMLPKNCAVVVLEVSGNRVVVGQDSASPAGDLAADTPAADSPAADTPAADS
ncbi:MAG: NfeD family protein [Planctomycetota bacterium]